MKLWLIAKNRIKKRKGSAVTLFFLIMAATILFYTGINVLGSIGSFQEEKNESQNGMHFQLVGTTGYDNAVTDILKEEAGYDGHETENALYSMTYWNVKNEKMNAESESMMMAFCVYNEDRKILHFDVTDSTSSLKKNEIYAPAYLKTAKGYQTGDYLEIEEDGERYSFRIAGFVEDMYCANPASWSVYRCHVTQETYEKLKTSEQFKEMRNYNVRLKNSKKSAEYEEHITGKIVNSEKTAGMEILAALNFSTMSNANIVMINIVMGIMTVFAVCIVLTSLVVIRFNIVTNLENNLPNVGILESMGYTVKQLIASVFLEYFVISTAGILAGLLVAFSISNLVSGVVSGTVGLFWKAKISIPAIVITVLVMMIAIALVCWFVTKRYKRITVLDALRGGMRTHNFKKNMFPLNKGILGLNVSLGLKEMFHAKKQAASIALIIAMLSYVCALVMGLYYNFVADDSALKNLIGMEVCSVDIDCSATDSEAMVDEILKKAEKIEGVRKVSKYAQATLILSKGNKKKTVPTDVFEDFSKVDCDKLAEGHYPRLANEIMISRLAADGIEASLGDTITVRNGNAKKDFVVAGISQEIQQGGETAGITFGGMERFAENVRTGSLYIYGEDGISSEQLKNKISEQLKEETKNLSVSNFEEAYHTMLGTFQEVIQMLCIVFVIITVVVILLITFMVIRMKMNDRKVMMGIYKALGYTTWQLIKQTAMSFAPIISVGGFIGCIAEFYTGNALYGLLLGGFGIEKATLVFSPWMTAVIFAAISLVAFAAAIWCAAAAKKIEPYKMIVEG